MVSSAGKVMASVFWNAKSIVFIAYLQKGCTINIEYYANLLMEPSQKGLLSRKLTKAPAHNSVVAMAAVRNCSFELVDHPSYSPDLAPSDFFLFPKMKKHLAGKRYQTDDEVISAVEDFFGDQDERFYTNGIKALEYHWKKCVQLQGDYVKK